MSAGSGSGEPVGGIAVSDIGKREERTYVRSPINSGVAGAGRRTGQATRDNARGRGVSFFFFFERGFKLWSDGLFISERTYSYQSVGLFYFTCIPTNTWTMVRTSAEA